MMYSLFYYLIILILFNRAYASWFNSKCKCRSYPIENLKEELDRRLICQDSSKEELYDILSDWYKERKSYNLFYWLYDNIDL